MVKVMLTDDHSILREGLKHLLETDGEFKVTAEAGDGEECLRVLEKAKPDVLILDMNMPNKNGLEVVRYLKARKSKIKILVLTNEKKYLVNAVGEGVNGYILKETDSKELKKAIATIVSGKRYIQSKLLPILEANGNINEDLKKINELTKREIEVLKSLSIGMYNKEIAEQLDISERTVKNHVSNIFKKIEVADRTQAAVFAIKNCLVDI